jgi:hypothetical protein
MEELWQGPSLTIGHVGGFSNQSLLPLLLPGFPDLLCTSLTHIDVAPEVLTLPAPCIIPGIPAACTIPAESCPLPPT